MKVILIDDESLARGLLKEYLEDFPDLEVVAECENGFEGIKAITQWKPDLVFLDIQMPKINGFEMLELLPEAPAVIFVTAFDAYAIKAFETQAIDYLLKPIDPERLRLAIQRWRERSSSYKPELKEVLPVLSRQMEDHSRVAVRKGTEIRVLPVSEVLALEACDDYVKVHTAEGYYLKKKTLQYFEEHWDSGMFFRVHRSYLINLTHLKKLEIMAKNSYLAILHNGFQVPVSRRYYSPLREILEG
jgi:two-component system LytT family response regulator